MMSPITKVLLFIKTHLKNHKKKYISFSLLLAIGYYVKRKISMENMLVALMKVIKILDYIPLPDPPKFREVPELEKVEPFDFSSALNNFLDKQSIGKKIRQSKEQKQKSALWKQMISNMMSVYIFTVGFFDLSQLFCMLKCKYINEFRYFGAEKQFLVYIQGLNSYFSNNLQNLFNYVKFHQQMKIDSYDPENPFTQSQFFILLKQLSQNLLLLKQDISQQKSIVKKQQLLDEDVNRFFYTDQQKSSPKSRGKILTFFGWVWSKLSIPTIQNHQYKVSEQRYCAIRQLFRMSLFQINDIRLQFSQNNKAEQLFDLVNQQLFDILRSLNFSQLWSASVLYNTQKVINRLQVYFQRKDKKKPILINYATLVSQICKEEFANPASILKNNKFLDKQLKQAIKLKMSPSVEDVKSLKLSSMLVQQLIQYKQLELAKNQFVLKYFYERGGIDVEPSSSNNTKGNDKQMQDFLSELARLGQDQTQQPQQLAIQPSTT